MKKRYTIITMLAGIAPLLFADTNALIEGKANYTAQTFVDVLEYGFGHELFHLIAKGYHGLPPNPLPPPDQEGPLAWPFRPLDKITIAPEELLQIDLPNRASVIK